MVDIDLKSLDIESPGLAPEIKEKLCGEMIASHHLLGTSPAARPYLQDCAARYAELMEVSNLVEISLGTCTWINS
ncbi:MAG: hypothetical protein GKC10_03180 [Methanosarcinales archaeon]|nr:hypothetical protein [Methanosarcinales archaeon]